MRRVNHLLRSRHAALFAVLLPGMVARAEESKPPLQVSSVAERALSARPGDSLFLTVGDRITVARVDRMGVSSRGIHLQIAGARVHGDIGGQRVTLDLGDRRIEGQIGANDVLLDISRDGATVKVSGRFGARGIAQELNPNSVTAEIGPCRYLLRFQHNEYAGQVGCGGDPEPVHLRVPASLVARGDVELAALFTSLLAR
jgi:hypothetical protein